MTLFFLRDFECTYHYPKATIFSNRVIRCGLEFFRVTEMRHCVGLHIYVYWCFDWGWPHLCLASVAVLVWSGLVWSVSRDVSTTLEWRL
jgi:hypothetical protein